MTATEKPTKEECIRRAAPALLRLLEEHRAREADSDKAAS